MCHIYKKKLLNFKEKYLVLGKKRENERKRIKTNEIGAENLLKKKHFFIPHGQNLFIYITDTLFFHQKFFSKFELPYPICKNKRIYPIPRKKTIFQVHEFKNHLHISDDQCSLQ